MAPRKSKGSTLELCAQATQLGNSVSVRMLEYLSTTKSHPNGFRDLASDFLDVSRILSAIEAGLLEASHRGDSLPIEMMDELDTKFKQTYDDFVVLNQMLLRFLDYERKGAFGRFQRGWHMMFSGTDVEKIRTSLVKSRDALRMSSLVFRWSIGDEKAEASVGIAHTGLVAALARMQQGQSKTPTAMLDQPQSLQHSSSMVRLSESASLRAPASHRRGASAANSHAPPIPSFEKASNLGRVASHKSLGAHSLPNCHSEMRALTPTPMPSSPLLIERADSFHTGSMSREHLQGIGRQEHVARDDSFFSESPMASTKPSSAHDEITRPNIKYPTIFTRAKADLSTVQRWKPRGDTSTGNSPASRSALRIAIERKDYRTVEQLLDSGIGAAGQLESDLLNMACRNLDSQSLRLLLLFGADPNGSDPEHDSPLMTTISMGFAEGAKMLLKYGANPNFCAGRDMKTALSHAVQENRFEFVHLCLMWGGDAAAALNNGSTALIDAVEQHDIDPQLIEIMLDYDTDVDIKDRDGRTALFQAIQSKRADIVELLLDHGANPNLPAPKHPLWPSTYQPVILKLMLAKGADPKKTPGVMELAASIKNIESIRILLDHGVSPNIRKDGIYTPLCSAIRDDSVEVVDLLLAHGADPNLNASEYPAFKCISHRRLHLLPRLVAAGANLHDPKGIVELAVAHNYWEALEYLLAQGVDPNDENDAGHTALTTAIREDRGDFVELLLANGADPHIRGQDWPICMAVKRPAILRKLLPHVPNPSSIRGVVEMACAANELESVKLLLKAGVSVEDKNGGVFSPLTTAIRDQRSELVRYLLDEAGADPNAPGEHLPIVKAIRRLRPNDYEIVEMLLAKGADMNQMYRGWNAILQAVEIGDAALLRLLIAKGGPVDVQAKDDDGRLVMDIIAERGWQEGIAIIHSQRQGRTPME